MWINSKGGLWSSSVGIVSAMNNSGIKFTTRNMGFCDSAGGHLFQAGAERIWNANAVGLVHEVQGFASEQIMEAMNASVATMLCGKTKQTTEQVRVLMKAETMIDHKMAYDLGFCDNDARRFGFL